MDEANVAKLAADTLAKPLPCQNCGRPLEQDDEGPLCFMCFYSDEMCDAVGMED